MPFGQLNKDTSEGTNRNGTHGSKAFNRIIENRNLDPKTLKRGLNRTTSPDQWSMTVQQFQHFLGMCRRDSVTWTELSESTAKGKAVAKPKPAPKKAVDSNNVVEEGDLPKGEGGIQWELFLEKQLYFHEKLIF